MTRLNVLVEGETEETFVQEILAPHLADNGIYVSGIQLVPNTARANSRRFKGGVVRYHPVRDALVRWMRQEDKDDARFTTVLDFYKLPEDFPGMRNARASASPDDLEAALADDVADEARGRFIPYLQQYEFEALVLADTAPVTAHRGDMV